MPPYFVKFEKQSSEYKLDKNCRSKSHLYHRWELIENLLKFTPINWELKLTNFSLGSKIYESY